MARLVQFVDSAADEKAEPGAPATLRWSNVFALFGLFVVAFLVAAFAVRSVLPAYLETSHIRQNYRHYERYASRYDTVFLGSSRVQFQVDPATFDRVMKERGLESCSFNFGIAALNGFGVEFVLNQILALSDGSLQRVIVDLGDMRWKLKEGHAKTEQVIVRHDTANTWRYLQLIERVEKKQSKHFQSAERHLQAWLNHMTSVGKGSQWLKGWVFRTPPPVRAPSEYDRFEPLDRRLTGERSPRNVASTKAHERFLSDPEKFERQVSRLGRAVEKFDDKRKDEQLTDAERGLVERVVAAIRDAGAEPYVFVAPRGDLKGAFVLLAQDEGLVEHVLNYTDPERFESFYEVANHFDGAHLNERGAILFTERVARDIAEIESGEKKAPEE